MLFFISNRMLLLDVGNELEKVDHHANFNDETHETKT